jgi:hypothetical protein
MMIIDPIIETIKYVFNFIPQLLNSLPYIGFIPLDFRLMLLSVLLGYFASRNKKAVEGYATWIIFAFLFFSAVKYWTQ